MARTDTYTRREPSESRPSQRTSIFQQMSSQERRDFHTPEAQRARNEARQAAKEKGEVYDISLDYKPSGNEEGIATATNDTFGNDEFTFDPTSSDDSSGGGGGGLPDGYEEEAGVICENGSPVEGFILFKRA